MFTYYLTHVVNCALGPVSYIRITDPCASFLSACKTIMQLNATSGFLLPQLRSLVAIVESMDNFFKSFLMLYSKAFSYLIQAVRYQWPRSLKYIYNLGDIESDSKCCWTFQYLRIRYLKATMIFSIIVPSTTSKSYCQAPNRVISC